MSLGLSNKEEELENQKMESKRKARRKRGRRVGRMLIWQNNGMAWHKRGDEDYNILADISTSAKDLLKHMPRGHFGGRVNNFSSEMGG